MAQEFAHQCLCVPFCSHDNAYLYVTESSTNNLFRVTL